MEEAELTLDELKELIGLLERRLAVIGDAELRKSDPEAQLAQLQEVSEAISAFHRDHEERIPFRLRHFLERSSLDKALAWSKEALEGM